MWRDGQTCEGFSLPGLPPALYFLSSRSRPPRHLSLFGALPVPASQCGTKASWRLSTRARSSQQRCKCSSESADVSPQRVSVPLQGGAGRGPPVVSERHLQLCFAVLCWTCLLHTSGEHAAATKGFRPSVFPCHGHVAAEECSMPRFLAERRQLKRTRFGEHATSSMGRAHVPNYCLMMATCFGLQIAWLGCISVNALAGHTDDF